MPRPKGAKDKKPRKMNPESLGNIRSHIPGNLSLSLRIHGPESSVRKFSRMEPKERGAIVHQAINHTPTE